MTQTIKMIQKQLSRQYDNCNDKSHLALRCHHLAAVCYKDKIISHGLNYKVHYVL